MSAPCPTFGFLVVMELATTIDASAKRELRDSWIGFLETRGLTCADGGTADETRAELKYVVASEASQATETDREAAQAWLASRRELRVWQVGGLEDFG
jgi:uncharacterized protein YggL (DUF469 family)